jgi:hypothetical protein
MSTTRVLIPVVVAILAIVALPATAAADPVVDSPEGFPLELTTEYPDEGRLATASGVELKCESVLATGVAENGSTGTLQLTYQGCRESSLGSKCTSAGQESGTILTTELLVHLKTVNGGSPAVLATSNEGHISTFTCAFGLIHVEVRGTGTIGEITAPGYNEPSSTTTLQFVQSEGVPKYSTVDGDETEYAQEVSFNGGELEAAATEAEITLSTPEGQEATLTEE